MNPTIAITAATIILLSMVVSSTALKCVVCDSESDEACIDGVGVKHKRKVVLKEKYLKSCSGGCSKKVFKYELLGTSYTRVERFCGQSYNNDYCKYPRKVSGGLKDQTTIYECSCKSNKCNSGNYLHMSLSLSAVMLMSAVWM